MWSGRWVWAVALALAIALPRHAVGESKPERVLVLSSSGGEAYDRTIGGLRSAVEEARGEARVDVRRLAGDERNLARVMAEVRTDPPDVLVTLGSFATNGAASVADDLPVVAALIVDSKPLQRIPNATAVVLEFPVAVELQWLARFLPMRKLVGVLYDPSTNSRKIAEAKEAARRVGIRLVSREVGSPERLPGALKSLTRGVDALWGLADPMVLSPATAKSILTFSFRNRIPFTGLSESWVKAGALYSLERDYADIGAQCADLVVRVLRGATASSLPPVRPRKVLYSINLSAARHMKLSLSDQLVEGATNVFE